MMTDLVSPAMSNEVLAQDARGGRGLATRALVNGAKNEAPGTRIGVQAGSIEIRVRNTRTPRRPSGTDSRTRSANATKSEDPAARNPSRHLTVTSSQLAGAAKGARRATVARSGGMIVENAAGGRRIRDLGNRGTLDVPPNRMAIR